MSIIIIDNHILFLILLSFIFLILQFQFFIKILAISLFIIVAKFCDFVEVLHILNLKFIFGIIFIKVAYINKEWLLWKDSWHRLNLFAFLQIEGKNNGCTFIFLINYTKAPIILLDVMIANKQSENEIIRFNAFYQIDINLII